MKVAYNKCFGGFNLSPLAETEYRKKKGINLTWYSGVGSFPYKKYVRVDNLDKVQKELFLEASKKDLGKEINKIPQENYFYESWCGEQNRNDPDLIEVIERLGEKANGPCSKLAIAEIPDGANFEIDEYDGNERVVPPRMSW